jgi:hypothetical protein
MFSLVSNLKYEHIRAMAQAVSRRPLTAKALVRIPVSPCGIYGRQSGIGTGFLPSSSAFPVIIIPPRLSRFILSFTRWTIGLLVAAVQRHSRTPSTRTTTTKCEYNLSYEIISKPAFLYFMYHWRINPTNLATQRLILKDNIWWYLSSHNILYTLSF